VKKTHFSFILLSVTLFLSIEFVAAATTQDVTAQSTPAATAKISRKDRIMGAIMGAFIGDALGVGTHWYYDLDKLKNDFGPWISDYNDPKLESTGKWAKVHQYRYDQGVRAGDASQTGQLITLLLESLVENGAYDRDDFAARVDKLFETLDGTSYSGLYSDEAIIDTWANRNAGISWDNPSVGSAAITSDGAQMNTMLAAVYFENPLELAKQANSNTRLFYSSDFTITHSVAYAMVVGGLINGTSLENILDYITSVERPTLKSLAYYDDSRIQVYIGGAAVNSGLTIDPPHLIAKVYGQHCEIQQLLPSAYFFIHRYPDDFKSAVLAAINGGGNNMARATLTGGMSGAMVGLSGIPERFIKGLNNHEHLLQLAEIVATLAE
jgi:ADP-ribosylglycohydrolase